MANARALIYCICVFALAGGCALVVLSIAMVLAYDLGRHDELGHMVSQAQHIAKEGFAQ